MQKVQESAGAHVTTEDMRIALLWHFRYVLHYPLVTTETMIADYFADIVAIRKIVVKVEIKRHLWEISQDLKKKRKHKFYLDDTLIWPKWAIKDLRPNKPDKFYFALPSSLKDIREKYQKVIPEPYGLILVKDDGFSPHSCETVKRGKYLKSRNDASTQAFKEIISRRLTTENIDLRLKLAEKVKK